MNNEFHATSSLSSSSSSSSSQSSRSSVGDGNLSGTKSKTTTNKTRGNRVKWHGNVKDSNEIDSNKNLGMKKDVSLEQHEHRQYEEPSSTPKRNPNGALSGLSPLTPLKKTSEEGLRPRYNPPPVGFAYSSPNLKSLNNFTNFEQARLRDDYLASALGSLGRSSNYVDPLYRHLNPQMTNAKSRPVWSLNQPLPHVLNQSLAEKMIQKNAEAKSRASSRSGSRDVSRAGSMTSLNDWKRLMRLTTSNTRPNDIESQLPRNYSQSQPLKQGLERNGETGQSGAERGQKGIPPSSHGAKFTLGDESYTSSTADDEKPKNMRRQNGRTPVRTDNDLLKEELNDTSHLEESGKDGGGSVILPDDESEEMAFTNYWAKVRYLLREPFAEFLGTLVLVIFGVGGNLQATVTNGAGGSYESLSFAWGFGCMLGVYVAGGISGGHINPSVTISMAIFRKFPWKKVPIYIFAQIVGAYFGGAMAYGYFWSSITEFEGGASIRTAATGACLFTNPKSYVTWRNAFFDEFIGAAMLVGCLMALLDDTNAPPANGMTALIVGFLVAAIGMALGYQTSFTINPARDLGPRIFASMIGYGPHAFHLTHWWWTWGAWGGPIAGGIAGALVYDLFIFTGCESPVNYPDNGYIEHRIQKLLHAEMGEQSNMDSPEVELDERTSSSNSVKI